VYIYILFDMPLRGERAVVVYGWGGGGGGCNTETILLPSIQASHWPSLPSVGVVYASCTQPPIAVC